MGKFQDHLNYINLIAFGDIWKFQIQTGVFLSSSHSRIFASDSRKYSSHHRSSSSFQCYQRAKRFQLRWAGHCTDINESFLSLCWCWGLATRALQHVCQKNARPDTNDNCGCRQQPRQDFQTRLCNAGAETPLLTSRSSIWGDISLLPSCVLSSLSRLPGGEPVSFQNWPIQLIDETVSHCKAYSNILLVYKANNVLCISPSCCPFVMPISLPFPFTLIILNSIQWDKWEEQGAAVARHVHLCPFRICCRETCMHVRGCQRSLTLLTFIPPSSIFTIHYFPFQHSLRLHNAGVRHLHAGAAS